MIPGATDGVSVLDQLIARWEVSRLNIVPVAISIVVFWPMLIVTVGVARAFGAKPIVFGWGMLVVWVALLVTELGRGLWTLRHRYASPRWLRLVYAAVGDDVAVHALAELMRQHRYEPDHVILRSDMASAVQQERAKRRDAAQRAEGVRLVEEPEATSGSEPAPTIFRISEAQRARACERRAGRAARTANWSAWP